MPFADVGRRAEKRRGGIVSGVAARTAQRRPVNAEGNKTSARGSLLGEEPMSGRSVRAIGVLRATLATIAARGATSCVQATWYDALREDQRLSVSPMTARRQANTPAA
jgi:hypothetical protein